MTRRGRPALHRLHRLLLLFLLFTAACATSPLHFEQSIVLLGEVHDNAAQHALRLRAFEAWLAQGARPALVLEQLDRGRQADIDRLRAQTPPPDADALIAAAGGPGWDWAFYRPFIALALRHGLPIVAANVSREEARQVMRDGLLATGFDPAVPPDLLDLQARDIEDSHCGMLDAPTARRMALAQVARDQALAAAVQRQAAGAVQLLAGNGHVRTDAGVPRWLTPAVRARTQAIGLLEEGRTESGQFDRVLRTAAQPRPDPCAALRGPRDGPAAR